MADAQRQLIALPHISVRDSLDLRDFELVSSADLMQFPKKYHPHVTSFGNMYRTLNHEVHDIGVLVRKGGSSRLGPLSEEERKQVDSVIDALTFASCYRDRFLSMAKDNFSYTIWNFPGNKKPTDMVNLANRRFSMQGVKNEPHLLQIPQYVHRQDFTNGSFNSELLTALLRCAYSERKEDLRFMRAIHWFNLAHADTDDLTEYTRFTMTSAAFEALLNTPRRGITDYFKNTVQMLLGQSDELQTWASEFYNARSRVVHGDDLPELMFGKHKHNSLLALADVIFMQCVYRQLDLKSYWPIGYAQSALRTDVVKYLIPNKERFAAIGKFHLNQGRDVTDHVENYLYQIQKYDQSIDLKDCNDAFKKVVQLALDGTSRLARMRDMRTKVHREFISAYKTAYSELRSQLAAGNQTNVYQSLSAVEDVGDRNADEKYLWGDAEVRAKRFGRAKLISLDSLHSAMYSIEDLRTSVMYL